jgi:hypothetical protein
MLGTGSGRKPKKGAGSRSAVADSPFGCANARRASSERMAPAVVRSFALSRPRQ